MIFRTRLLLAVASVVFIGGVVAGSTGAFFSDTETSQGNTFAAGEIDLKVANTSYATDDEGNLAASPSTSWGYDDALGLFFNFDDVKPGDYGEDTIRLTVNTNPAWMCGYVTVTDNRDATCNDPELEDDPSCDLNGTLNGELAQNLSVLWWADDGDNVLEDNEEVITLAHLGDAPVGTQLPITLADSTGNIWNTNGGPVAPGVEHAIGKGWCFGEITLNPVAQDGLATEGPLTRGTGFTCDGSNINNAPQTDEVMLNVTFYAEQARHNDAFVCEGAVEPTFTQPVGSALGQEYPHPEQCDVEVDDDGTADYTNIAQAVSDTQNVPDGSVVCVDAGTYEPFSVNRPLTIVGLHDPSGPNAAVVSASGNISDIVLVTSSNVTLKGLKVLASDPLSASQVAGVRVSPAPTIGGGDIEDVAITHNVVGPIASASGSNASVKGIQLWTEANSGTTFRNITIEHNIIDGIQAADAKGTYGVQTVGALENVLVRFNTIENLTTANGGWGAGVALDAKEPVSTTNVRVERNHIMGVTTPVAGAQVEANVDGTGIRINNNNLESLLYGGSSGVPSTAVLNAENNWWGDTDPTDDVFVNPPSNTVDYLPFKVMPFPQN
ncbi:MAG: hypothetical protein KatS3mg099_088 [Candidatus Parcubacteria bacterium]|nr:MAG: hypothetical protein KatS3mg099_088 [Candidatus Parcubacteria bacterium]